MNRAALILVVEDNPANQLLTSSVLEREGYQVEVADSSLTALELLADHKPDLILMDVQLPGLDGLSFARTLMSTTATAAIPIVALTAHAMAGDREQALAAGCAGYITKPIDTRTFGKQLRAFLPLSSTVDDSSRTAAGQESR
jgi:CheY-like chemotaxis protein